MDVKKETRSSSVGMSPDHRGSEGVGARYRGPSRQPQGGRYLDICTVFETSEKKSRDPRLDELRDMGLGIFWRSLAEQIGYYDFMLVWAALSVQASDGDDGHRVYIPRFDSYMRFQRNRYVQALGSSGASVKEIKRLVHTDLGEVVHEECIRRVIRSLR